MLLIEPRRPALDHPFAFGGRRWVAGRYNTTALANDRGSTPANQKTILALTKLREFVKSFQVVGTPLVLLDVVLILAGAKLDELAITHTPEMGLLVVIPGWP